MKSHVRASDPARHFDLPPRTAGASLKKAEARAEERLLRGSSPANCGGLIEEARAALAARVRR